MIPAGQDSNFVLYDLINKPVFLIYSPRPAALQFMLQRLWLPDAFKRIALDIFNQIDDSKRLLAILFDPPSEVFESGKIKFQASHGLPQARVRLGVL